MSVSNVEQTQNPHVGGASGSSTLLAMENITKRFSGVIANSGVIVYVNKDEVYALLDENYES